MKARLLTLASLAALTAACATGEAPAPEEDNPNTSDDTSDNDPNRPEASGNNLEVLLTDAPGDFDEVWVDIVSVEVDAGDAGWITLADQPQSFDLLTLQNDVTAALGGASLAPGTYGQLRLIVDNAFVVLDGNAEDLKIASGMQTGIKINLDTEIVEGMKYSVVIDFDAQKSVKSTGQGWLMTPVIFVKDVVAEPIPEPEPEPEPEPGDEGGADAGAGDDGAGDDGAPVE